MSQLGEHPADLAFLALGQDQLELGGLSLAADDPSTLGADLAVGQPDAFGQLGDHFRAGKARDQRAIDLLDPIARMGQLVRELPVIGEDHQAGAILIEAADGVDPLGNFGQKVDDARAARGIEVCRDISLGFVDGVINGGFESDGLGVNHDPSNCGIDPRAELANDLAIDGNPSLQDQLLASPPRSESRMRQDLLKPLELSRLAFNRSALRSRLRAGFVSRAAGVPGFSATRRRMRAGAMSRSTRRRR